MMTVECNGILLRSGICLSKSDWDEIFNQAARLKPPAHTVKTNSIEIEIDAILRVFPDFPKEERYRTPDSLRNLRRRWWKNQGLSWNGALTFLSPLWVLTCETEDLLAKRNIGPKTLKEIEQWRKQNKNKIPAKE
ncbi:MAG: hypothetical protein HZC02_02655 [Candidatus Levybacteria bacterium]|nr:hypothetical protein [Candidatus Levybacteria bacterium]